MPCFSTELGAPIRECSRGQTPLQAAGSLGVAEAMGRRPWAKQRLCAAHYCFLLRFSPVDRSGFIDSLAAL